MPVCEVDLRVGGAYRYRWRSEETGREFGSAGVHTAVEPFMRIVTSERMEGFDGEAKGETDGIRVERHGGDGIVKALMRAVGQSDQLEVEDGLPTTGVRPRRVEGA